MEIESVARRTSVLGTPGGHGQIVKSVSSWSVGEVEANLSATKSRRPSEEAGEADLPFPSAYSDPFRTLLRPCDRFVEACRRLTMLESWHRRGKTEHSTMHTLEDDQYMQDSEILDLTSER